MPMARKTALLLLRGYKWGISPLFPPSCRYLPTCSEYAMEVVERYGAFRGGWMALARILRCHPFAKGGYDPVVGENGHAHEMVALNRQTPVRNRERNAMKTLLR